MVPSVRQKPAPPFHEIQSADLVTQVSEQLAEAIVAGSLAPGQRLVEAEVARQMGISRAPVREAARRLEQRGLLVAHPRRGFFVRCLTLEEIDDLYGLRICLECYAARLASQRAGPEDLAALRAQLERLRSLAEAGAVGAQVEEDLRFHMMICEISGNRKLLGLFSDLASEVRMIIAVIGQLYDNPARIAETHLPLIEAIESGDMERIDAEIQHHIGVAWREVQRFFAIRQAESEGTQPAPVAGPSE